MTGCVGCVLGPTFLLAHRSGLAASILMASICIFNRFPGEVAAAFAHTSTASYRSSALVTLYITVWSAAVSGGVTNW